MYRFCKTSIPQNYANLKRSVLSLRDLHQTEDCFHGKSQLFTPPFEPVHLDIKSFKAFSNFFGLVDSNPSI